MMMLMEIMITTIYWNFYNKILSPLYVLSYLILITIQYN